MSSKSKCTACGKFLSPLGAATCTQCPSMYHKGCMGINESVAISSKWVCPECTKNKRRNGDNSCTPVKNVTQIEFVSEPKIPTPIDDEETDIRAMRRELAEYMLEFRDFRKEFRSSLASITSRVDAIEHRLDAVEKQVAEVTMDTDKVERLQQTVVSLKKELNDRDQDLLLSDLDIGHVPEGKGEFVMQKLTVIAAKLGVTLDSRVVVFAERVGAIGSEAGSGALPRRIVVRLSSRALRDEILQAARVRRNLTSADAGLTGPARRIYINERLTRVNSHLFHRVREECRKQQWRYSWTKKGRIYARQGDGKQVYPIHSEGDLSRVFKTEVV